MRPIDTEMLKVIRAALLPNEERDKFSDNIDYEAVYSELNNQAVISLTGDIMYSLPIKGELLQRWEATVYRMVFIGTKLSSVEAHVLQLLKDVEVCIMKGSAAAIYYPHPEIRTFGDIDLLVHPKDYQHSIEILIEDGFEVLDPERPTGRNIQLFKDGVEVELHQSYFGGRFMQEADKRDERLFKAMATCQYKHIYNHMFPMFDDENNGMILLHHFHRHILAGVGLRHLIDWMMFVSRVCDDDFWYNKFQNVVKQLDLIVFAKTITRMCQLYLGLRQTITWCHDVDEKNCELFMEYLLESGNFGKKQQQTVDSLVFSRMSTRKSFLQEWKLLQKKGLENWCLVQKYPALSGLAWLYQLGIYAGKILRMRAITPMLTQHRKAAECNRMFRAFHVVK